MGDADARLPARDETPIRVLVVEDEAAIRRGLCDVLAYHGFHPTGVDNGEDGIREGLREGEGAHDLALLDVMLPGVSGFDVCEALREARPELPILMLTARGSEEDVLRGFRCGSDDYVTKPFSVAQLVARVEALLRRTRAEAAADPACFEIGAWKVDPDQLVATRDDATVDLTRRELEMLTLFHRERGRIVSRRLLLKEVWGFSRADRIETRTVDMHVAKLRRKLGDDARRLIETVRGEGYRSGG